MDEEALAGGLSPPRIEDIGPDGEEGLRQAGRLAQLHAGGHGERMGGRRGGVFGIAAAGQQRTDPVAELPER